MPALRDDGHAVLRLVRRPPAGGNGVGWDPATRTLHPSAAGRRRRRGMHRPVVLPPVPRVALRLAISEFASVDIVAG